MEKKVSDIILELEDKINLILGFVKTNDLNNKLILDRLNKLGDKQFFAQIFAQKVAQRTFPQIEMDDEHTKMAKEAAIQDLAVADPIVSKDPVLIKKTNDELPILEEDPGVQPGRRDIRVPGTPDSKKTVVSQKLLYPDGKVAVLATVKVYDMQNKLIKQTRTNSGGKYTVSLSPGKYMISIYKPATTDKPQIKEEKIVEVQASDSPMEIG
jgi:hypothetical protein